MLGHDTPVSVPTPDGTDSAAHRVPPSVVPTITPVPKSPNPTAVHTDVEAQEIASRPIAADGDCCWVQACPALSEAKIPPTPTAKQSALLGHETPFSGPDPLGGLDAVHCTPPVVVLMIVEPAPVLPVLPTATQARALEHEIPVRSTAFGGAVCEDQVDPVLDVPMT